MAFTRNIKKGRTKRGTAQFEVNVILDKTREIIEETVRRTAIDVQELLSKPINEGGISPYDYFKNMSTKDGRKPDYRQRIVDSWKIYERPNKSKTNKIQFRFVNTAGHSPYLFGQRTSSGSNWRGVNANFRSAKKHAKDMYNSDKVTYKRYAKEPDRTNQLTKRKWEDKKDMFRKQLKTNIIGDIRGVR